MCFQIMSRLRSYSRPRIIAVLTFAGVLIATLSFTGFASIDAQESDAPTRTMNPEAQKYNNRGLNYFSRNDFKNALKEFRKAAKVDPQNPEYPNNAGIAELNLRRPADALQYFETAIQLNKDLPLYHYNRGLALMQLSRPRQAEEAFLAATARNPEYFEAWVYLGLLQYNERKFAKAEEAWRKAADLREDAEVTNNLGMALLEQNKTEEAEQRFREAISINASYPLSYFNLGVLLQRRNNWAEAEKQYRQAVRLDPNNFQPYYNLAIVLENQEKADEAIQALKTYLQKLPPQAAQLRADAEARLKRLQSQ